ncbi:MAG: hypothetical protein WCS42_04930 [Verrucomicrobiota bacterium]
MDQVLTSVIGELGMIAECVSLSLVQALEQRKRKLTGQVASKIYILTGEDPGWTAAQLRAYRCGQRDVLRGENINTDPAAAARYFAYLLELLFSAAAHQGELQTEQVGRQLSCDLHDLAVQYGLVSEIKLEMQQRRSTMVPHPFYGNFVPKIDEAWRWLFYQQPVTKPMPPRKQS